MFWENKAILDSYQYVSEWVSECEGSVSGCQWVSVIINILDSVEMFWENEVILDSYQYVSKWVSEWVCMWVSECEWVCECEWASEWVSLSVSVFECGWVWVSECE